MKFYTSVQAFASRMVAALEQAGPRPGKVENAERNGWTDDRPDELQMLFCGYGAKLNHAMNVGDVAEASRQCVNVANAAMMLAEVLDNEGPSHPRQAPMYGKAGSLPAFSND